MKQEEIKKQVSGVIMNEIQYDGKTFFISEKNMDYIYSDMIKDYDIVKEKVLKAVDKINELNQTIDVMDLDFENDIYPLI